MTFEAIMKDLKQGKFAPVYTLQGEEPYFIDQISDYIEANALPEAEKAFNQTIVYGKEINYLNLMDIVRRYPMMSPHQVVILKEAQQMKDLDKLEAYIENPMPSTIFVICHKHKKVDMRRTFAKKLKEKSVFFTSEPIREGKVPDWIESYLSSRGVNIDPRASILLEEYLGTDLSKIVNSLDKLLINVEAGKAISTADIEKYIGISKDYNVFELNNALMKRDVLKANKIINYFGSNPKSVQMPVLMGALYSLFSKIYQMHAMPGADDRALASQLKIPPFFVRGYKEAGRNYSAAKTESVIELLHIYDLKSKGVNAYNPNHSELMRELVYKILH